MSKRLELMKGTQIFRSGTEICPVHFPVFHILKRFTVIGIFAIQQMHRPDHEIKGPAADILLHLFFQMCLQSQFHAKANLDTIPVSFLQFTDLRLVCRRIQLKFFLSGPRISRIIHIIVIGNTDLFHSKGDRPFDHFFRTRLAVRGKAGVHMTVCNHILPPYPFIQVFALIAQTM